MAIENKVTRVCSECSHGIDIECATKFECELEGTIHYAQDTCDNYCEYTDTQQSHGSDKPILQDLIVIRKW